MLRIFIFILVLIILLLIYLTLFNNNHKRNHTNTNIKTDIDSKFNQNSNDININTNENENINDIQGYENEIMYISDDLKDGSYINQFKEIDYSKMTISNNQIGFNPEPKCSSGPLPFVDVNVNYLLNEK